MHLGGVAPQIVDGETKVSAEDGSVASLRCQATGSPAPTIYWRRGKEEVLSCVGRSLIQTNFV